MFSAARLSQRPQVWRLVGYLLAIERNQTNEKPIEIQRQAIPSRERQLSRADAAANIPMASSIIGAPPKRAVKNSPPPGETARAPSDTIMLRQSSEAPTIANAAPLRVSSQAVVVSGRRGVVISEDGVGGEVLKGGRAAVSPGRYNHLVAKSLILIVLHPRGQRAPAPRVVLEIR